MKKVSKKQSVINRKLKKVYKELALERPKYCTGCGRNHLAVNLSHSHIIPRSRRPELQLDKRNITYHCTDSIIGNDVRKGCHSIWESKDRHQLLDYMLNLEYILEVDAEYYYLISDI